MFNQRLNLGKYLGIRVYVHWTFALLLAFFAYQVHEAGWQAMLFAVFFAMTVFFCVTLHEYGHALTARKFGIGTVDITLLPIGGVARLERMPRIPWQELVVAIAGPAVNVVIAIVLAIALSFLVGFDELAQSFGIESEAAIVDPANFVEDGDAITTPAQAMESAELDAQAENAYSVFMYPSVLSFFGMLLTVNIALVIFNMIPAFPMDGGRVLRSVLAMVMDYRRATFVASRIGLACAVLMAFAYFYSDVRSPAMILIPMFIAYAGMTEAKQVDVMEALRGLKVRDAMIQNPPAVPMDMTLLDVAENWKSLSVPALPVMSGIETVVGLLRLSEVVKAIDAATDKKADPPIIIQTHPALAQTAGQLADHSVPRVRASESLDDVVLGLGRAQRQVPVVDAGGYLVGLLDLDQVRARAPLAKLFAPEIMSLAGTIESDAVELGTSGDRALDNGTPEDETPGE